MSTNRGKKKKNPATSRGSQIAVNRELMKGRILEAFFQPEKISENEVRDYSS